MPVKIVLVSGFPADTKKKTTFITIFVCAFMSFSEMALDTALHKDAGQFSRYGFTHYNLGDSSLLF